MNTVTKTKYELKAGTKTVWIEVLTESTNLLKAYYNNMLNSAPHMRTLGGSETLTKSYTCNGYVVTKIVSKSPCKAMKIVYEFNFTERFV